MKHINILGYNKGWRSSKSKTHYDEDQVGDLSTAYDFLCHSSERSPTASKCVDFETRYRTNHSKPNHPTTFF